MIVAISKENSSSVHSPTILLASDSESLGRFIRETLTAHGFQVCYAGHYSAVGTLFDSGSFDVVLLEVTGLHAVEPAVQAALRVKRANGAQLVAYAADASLETSGLAGDGIVPRSSTLPAALRRLLAEGEPPLR